MNTVTDDHNIRTLPAFFIHDLMDLLHKRAGRIDTVKPLFFHLFIYIAGDAMGTDDHDPFPDPPKFFFIMNDLYPLSGKVLDHFFVMDDRPIGIDLLVLMQADLLIYGFYRPLHPRTESRGLR